MTTDPFGVHGIRMYPDQDPSILEETRRYFEKLAERFSNDLAKACLLIRPFRGRWGVLGWRRLDTVW